MRRFFCGNCGEEVNQRDELCPHCGAVFSAIKCPQCGYRGKLHEFHHGCPSCGFLGEHRVRDTGAAPSPRTAADSRPGFFRKLLDLTSGRSASATEGAPAWLFWLILAAMVASFGVLALVYISM
jgi:predicted RNA-binding Zn-ribbon protein involved in translation (DUF1610 family)